MTDSTSPSSVPDQPFHLSAGGELKPARESDWPQQVSGLEAFYYWKDAILVGSYVHPARRFSLDITRDRLDGYIDTFRRMQSNGVGVPILMDHTTSAAATLGWIVDLKREGDRLMELHQFLGTDARDIGLRNKVSLGIDPDFIDGKGNHYGEAIVHSAVTPVPVVPDQGDFEPVLMLSLNAGGDGIVEPDSPSLAVSRVQPLAASRGQDVASVKPQAVDSHMALNHLALTALVDAAAVKRDSAVARGAIDPAVAEELFALLVRDAHGQVRTITLSRGSDEDATPLALAIFEVLGRNRPAPLGEVTALQALSRQSPGDDGATAELQNRMIALASGR